MASWAAGGKGVQDLADPLLAASDASRSGMPGGDRQLGRHAFDLFDTAVVVAGVDHGLLLGHLRLVLLLRHADRANTATVEELTHHRLVTGQQHLAGTEHDQVLAEQHADVVGHRTGDVDVVRHDQDRGVDLSVDVDQQLGQVRGANRVQTGVGLVAEDDLRVEHQ